MIPIIVNVLPIFPFLQNTQNLRCYFYEAFQYFWLFEKQFLNTLHIWLYTMESSHFSQFYLFPNFSYICLDVYTCHQLFWIMLFSAGNSSFSSSLIQYKCFPTFNTQIKFFSILRLLFTFILFWIYLCYFDTILTTSHYRVKAILCFSYGSLMYTSTVYTHTHIIHILTKSHILILSIYYLSVHLYIILCRLHIYILCHYIIIHKSNIWKYYILLTSPKIILLSTGLT
jgi:hypothetical protein